MVQLKGIKNIIFDLGNVIININPELTVVAFKKLFHENYNKMELELHSKNVLEKFETGELSSAAFILFFNSFNSCLNTKEINKAWNSMLLNIPKKRIDLIKQLASQYRVFLLSNTNEIHLNFINEYVSKKFQLDSLSILFEKTYYSHKMGLRKPDAKIFKAILKDKTLIPKETLFIDDCKEHIITAKKLNLKTHHLLATETILTIFNEN